MILFVGSNTKVRDFKGGDIEGEYSEAAHVFYNTLVNERQYKLITTYIIGDLHETGN